MDAEDLMIPCEWSCKGIQSPELATRWGPAGLWRVDFKRFVYFVIYFSWNLLGSQGLQLFRWSLMINPNIENVRWMNMVTFHGYVEQPDGKLFLDCWTWIEVARCWIPYDISAGKEIEAKSIKKWGKAFQVEPNALPQQDHEFQPFLRRWNPFHDALVFQVSCQIGMQPLSKMYFQMKSHPTRTYLIGKWKEMVFSWPPSYKLVHQPR